MSNRDIMQLARKVARLESGQRHLSRAAQLANSSVRTTGGSEVSVSDGLGTAQDNSEDLLYLGDQVGGLDSSLDQVVDYESDVPDWLDTITGSVDAAWDSSEFAVDLAKDLDESMQLVEADLTQAKQDLEAALQELDDAQLELDTLEGKMVTVESDITQAKQDILDAEADVLEAKNLANSANTTATEAKASADGKNTIYYSTPVAPPGGFRDGDTWYDNTGVSPGGTIIKIWTDGAWYQSAIFGSLSVLDGSITNAKIGNLDAGKITTGFLSSNRIEAGSIVAGKLATDSVVADNIVSRTITGDKIVSETITANEIATNAITADKILAGSIVAGKLAADSVIADNIVSDTITGDKIVSNAITADKIDTNAVTSGKIKGDAIDGMTITGALIRTAPTGQRVQMDVNGIGFFNGAGNRTLNLSSDGGVMSAKTGDARVDIGVFTPPLTGETSSVVEVSRGTPTNKMSVSSSASTYDASISLGWVGDGLGTGTQIVANKGGGFNILSDTNISIQSFGAEQEIYLRGNVKFGTDTNWANFPREAGVTGTARWRRYLGVIYIDVTTTSTVGANTNTRIGTLPAGARPAVLTALPAGASGAQNEIAVASVDTAGVVRAAVRGGAARPVNISGSFLQ